MKIRHVRSFLLSYPLPDPWKLAYFGGERIIRKRDAMLIRIETDCGLIGWAPGPPSEAAHWLIERQIAPFLDGRSLADPDALRVQFLKAFSHDPVAVRTYCAVEIGLYDLVGKVRGVPVSELLGGRVRDRIRLYACAGLHLRPEALAREAAAIRERGFTAYKMRLGAGPEDDRAAVAEVRRAVGPDLELMVDAHAWWRMGDRNYTPAAVSGLAEGFADENVAWLEEPFAPDDHAAYRRLKEQELLPLAAGEHEPAEARHLDLILTGCVDYVQMDVASQGGYPAGRRLLSEAAREGLRFAFHCAGTDLDVLVAGHLGVCWPEHAAEWLEYPCYAGSGADGMYPFPLAQEVLRQPLEFDHGELIVPRKAGLGIDVDESVMERYPWVPGPWSEFAIASPPTTVALGAELSRGWASRE